MNEATYRMAPFDQSTYLNAGRNPSSAGGACHLFALKWLSEIVHDKSTGSQARVDALIRYAAEVKMLYKAFSTRWGEGEAGADDGVANLLKLSIDGIVEYHTIALLAAAAREEHRKGYVYTFRFASGGAHSIGVYRSGATFGGHIYVLEPNYGEYKMGKGQFLNWAKWLQTTMYGAYGAISQHQLRPVSKYVSSGGKFGGVKVM